MVQKRASRSEAREALLTAAEEVLAEHCRQAPERIFEGFRGVLRANDIARRAGYGSPASINRLWADEVDGDGNDIEPMKAFVLDLAERMSVGAYNAPFLAEQVRTHYMQGHSWEQTIHAVAQLEFDRLTDAETGGDQWLVWLTLAPYAMGEGPARAAYNRARLDAYIGELSELYSFGLLLWNRRMRSGLTALDLAEAMSALVDGFTLHRRLDEGDRVTRPLDWVPPSGDSDQTWSLWQIAVWGVVEAMTEPGNMPGVESGSTS